MISLSSSFNSFS